jgi:hypothetical protein
VPEEPKGTESPVNKKKVINTAEKLRCKVEQIKQTKLTSVALKLEVKSELSQTPSIKSENQIGIKINEASIELPLGSHLNA